jgi:hypothetical protein
MEATKSLRIVIFSLIFFHIASTLLPTLCLAQQRASIRIPSGTEVPVVISEKLSSGTHSAGSEFSAKVANDVSVSGVVVFRNGAPVTGVVESAKKKGAVGAAGRLAISLKSTHAVDGTTVALSGSKEVEGESSVGTAVIITVLCCILGLLMQGGNADIPAGTQISSRTAQEATITVEK